MMTLQSSYIFFKKEYKQRKDQIDNEKNKIIVVEVGHRISNYIIRKLLFNIYIVNFGRNYYQATTSEELQAKILLYTTTMSTYGVTIMDLWEMYEATNLELQKDFLCIPPCSCVTGQFVRNLYKALKANNADSLRHQIYAAVNRPAQRAYQMEYRYKCCDIFEPFLSVIEYATYDALKGNWICAYLSFLPIVEAVIRQWYEKIPGLSFSGMKKTSELYKNQPLYTDDRKAITDGLVDYLKYILEDVLYIRFDDYKKKGYADTFNRNLSLHKLSGVTDPREGMRNLTRLLLVLDIIAELYLMQTPKKYWQLTFYATPENIDYQIRFELYKKWRLASLGPDDLLIVGNYFISKKLDNAEKEKFIEALKLQEQIENEVRKIAQTANEK